MAASIDFTNFPVRALLSGGNAFATYAWPSASPRSRSAQRGPCQCGFDLQDRRRVRFSIGFTLARQHKDFLQVVMILVAHFGELGVVGQVVVATAHGKATLVDPCNHERGVVEVDD